MKNQPSENNSLYAEIHELVAASLLGKASPDDMARLEAIVRDNSHARDIYLAYIAETNVLRTWSNEGIKESLAGEMDSSEIEGAAQQLLVQRRLKPVVFSRNAIYAAVGSVAAALIFFAFWVLPAEPVFVATITGGQGQRWADGGLAMPPSLNLQENQLLNLESGLVEVMFHGGVQVILEGPVKFTAQTLNSGYLHRGKLLVEVIDCPDGFVVQTPKVTILDLGTEFGVEVGPSETTDMRVFQGAIEATPKHVGGEQVLLTAGLTARFGADGSPLIGGTEGLPSRTHRFVRSVDFAASRLGERKYNKRGADSKPFVHFDVNFAGETADSPPRVGSPVAGDLSTMPSSARKVILRDGYTDSLTSETIGGNGTLVAELGEPYSFVKWASDKADVLHGTGVVTVEFDLMQDSACNKNVFIAFADEDYKAIGMVQLGPNGLWRLVEYMSSDKLDAALVQVGGSRESDTLPGTLVHYIYQLDLDANEQRISLDGGATFSSASIPENSSYRQFGIGSSSTWEHGSIVIGNVHIESASAEQGAKQNLTAREGNGQ